MHEVLIVTASELDDHEWCPQYHDFRHKQRRRLIALEPEWAIHGNWAHKQLEQMIQGHPPRDLPPSMPGATGRALVLSMHAWWERFGKVHPWDHVLMAEKPGEVNLGWLGDGVCTLERTATSKIEVRFRGIPDGIVVWHGQGYHLSHKTTGPSTPVDVLCQGLAHSLHENLYPLLAREWFPDLPWGGTCANIIRKLAEKRAIEAPEQALHIEFLPITAEGIERARLDALDIVLRIAESRERVHRRRKGCLGIHGNSKCAYFGVCWERISIDNDTLYESYNPTERYERPE